MEKKTYIKPEAEEIVLEPQQMMAGSNFTPESGDDYEEGDVAGSNERRGTWGNLWD